MEEKLDLYGYLSCLTPKAPILWNSSSMQVENSRTWNLGVRVGVAKAEEDRGRRKTTEVERSMVRKRAEKQRDEGETMRAKERRRNTN
jgi:hypothetical protein